MNRILGRLLCAAFGHKRMKRVGPRLINVSVAGMRYVCPRCGYMEDRKVRAPKPPGVVT